VAPGEPCRGSLIETVARSPPRARLLDSSGCTGRESTKTPDMRQREQAEAVRIQAVYRRLVLLGKARLPPAMARRLLGPDLAYRLYGSVASDGRRTRRD